MEKPESKFFKHSKEAREYMSQCEALGFKTAITSPRTMAGIREHYVMVLRPKNIKKKQEEENKMETRPRKYKEVKYYEEWLAGQHGGHESYQRDNYLYCDTCSLKFCTGLSPGQITKALRKVHQAETKS